MTVSRKFYTTLVVLWVLNIACAQALHFNPMACWVGPIIAPVWKAYAEVLFLCSLGFFVFALFTGWQRVPVTVLALILISAAPQFAHILTGGGSCQ